MFFEIKPVCCSMNNEILKNWINRYCCLVSCKLSSETVNDFLVLWQSIESQPNVCSLHEEKMFRHLLLVEISYVLAGYHKQQYHSLQKAVFANQQNEQQVKYLSYFGFNRKEMLYFYSLSLRYILEIRRTNEIAKSDYRIDTIACDLYASMHLAIADLMLLAKKESQFNPKRALKYSYDAESICRDMFKNFDETKPSNVKAFEIKNVWMRILNKQGELHHRLLLQSSNDPVNFNENVDARSNRFFALERGLKSNPLLRIKNNDLYNLFCSAPLRLQDNSHARPLSPLRSVFFPVEEVEEKISVKPVEQSSPQGRYGKLETMFQKQTLPSCGVAGG